MKEEIKECAFDEDVRIRLSQFNEKVALQTFKMCMGDKAELYLSQLEPPEPEKKNAFGRTSELDSGASLSDLDGLF